LSSTRAITAEASTYSASGDTRYRELAPPEDFLSAARRDLAVMSSFLASFSLPVWTSIMALEQAEITSLLSLRTLSLLSS